MESSPQYVCIWLGLTKIGVCPALINFNLREDSLAHCINISEAKAVIYSAGLLEGKCVRLERVVTGPFGPQELLILPSVKQLNV